MGNMNDGKKGETEVSLFLNTQLPESKIQGRSFIEDPITETRREVDGIISEVEGTSYIEVRDRRTKGKIDWVDQVKGKYINIERKRIFVASYAGFTATAVKQAMPDEDIELMAFERDTFENQMQKYPDFKKCYQESAEISVGSYDFYEDQASREYISNDGKSKMDGSFKVEFDVQSQFISQAINTCEEYPNKTNLRLTLKDIPAEYSDGTEGSVNLNTSITVQTYIQKINAQESTIIYDSKSGRTIGYLLAFLQNKKCVAYSIYHLQGNTFLLYVDMENFNTTGIFNSGRVSYKTPFSAKGYVRPILKFRFSKEVIRCLLESN